MEDVLLWRHYEEEEIHQTFEFKNAPIVSRALKSKSLPVRV